MKYTPDGSIAWYKAWLIAQSFSQIHEIDFNKTFSPIIRRESLQIFLAISCFFKPIIKQIDIIEAYLQSLLSNNKLSIFMKLPPSFELFRSIKVGLVCRLFYSIYSLRQSGRLWNQKVISFLISFGFYLLNADTSILIYHGSEKGYIRMVSVYIDNFLLAIKYGTSINWIKGNFKNKYNIKEIREVKTIIDWQVI